MAEATPDTVVDIRNGLREARNEVEALKTRLATQEETLTRRLEPRGNLIAIDYQVLRDLVAANYQGLQDRLANLENRPFEQLFLDALDHYRLQALQHSANIFQLETTNNVLQLRRQVASLETRLTQEQLGRLRPLSERIEGVGRDVERLEQRTMALEARSNVQRTIQSVGNRVAADAARRVFSANTDREVASTRPIELPLPTEAASNAPTEVAAIRLTQEALSSSFHPAVNPVLETTAIQHPTVRAPWDRAYIKEEEEDAIREVYGEDYIPNKRMRLGIPSTVQVITQQSSIPPALGLTDEEVEEQVRAFYSLEPSPQGTKFNFAPQPLSRLSPNVDRTRTFKTTDLHLSRYATKTPEPIDPAVALAKFKAAALKSSIKIKNPSEAQGENKKIGGRTFNYPTYEDKDKGKDKQPIGIWSPIIAESEGPSEPFPPFDPTVGDIDGGYHSDLAFGRPLFLPPALDQGNLRSPPRSFSTVMQPEQSAVYADNLTELDSTQTGEEQEEIVKRILERVDVVGKSWRSQSTEQSDQSETLSPNVRNPPVGTRTLGSLLDPQSKALILRRNQRPQDIPTLRLASTISKNETVYINEAVIGVFRGHTTTYIGDLIRSPFRNATLTIHLTIDSCGIPSILLVGHIYDTGARPSFMFEEGREVSYRKYSLRFDIPDCLVSGSLELGTVSDVMLLPASVATSLGDPNEVPDDLRYIAFHFKDRVATGFDTMLMPNARDMVSEDAMSADAIKFFKFMGYFAAQQEGRVRVWFLAKGGEVDNMFTKMRAVSAGGLPKVWKDRSVVWKATEVDGRVFWRL